MSRAAYQLAVAALKAEHPWLAKQVVEPALATWRCWRISWANANC